METLLNIDTARSYATETNLTAALMKLGFADPRVLVVRNRSGRYTAIFPASLCNGDMTVYARAGFMTIG